MRGRQPLDPQFGTLDAIDRLITAAQDRTMKVLLDYVPNHTSDQHPWFVESRSSRENAKRDWYIWRDAKPDGAAPNNWVSEFGGSAWCWDQHTGSYYYHAFLKEQPDLNWRNPEVREAMLGVLRFWFDRGVDGFRVDAIHQLFEDLQLRDNPPNPDWRDGLSPARRLTRTYSVDQPEVHEAIRAMRQVSDTYSDRLMIGEAYLPIDRLMRYYGVDLTGFHLPFNFHLISSAWNPTAIASLIEAYEAALPTGAWPNWVLGNHDRPRVASRIGRRQARIAAMLLLTLRGTPTIYQGEEIGMTDVPIPPERIQDPWERNVPGLGLGRDPVRTPMQWDAGPHAGFSSSEPWLPLDVDFETRNVAVLQNDPASILNLYRRLINLRRSHPALSIGHYVPVHADAHILAYERRHSQERHLVVLNFCDSKQSFPLSRATGNATILLSTDLDREGGHAGSHVELRPDEGVLIALHASDDTLSMASS
jgi:alpha-glucosidase